MGGYTGNSGDSMTHHNGEKFLTKDQDSDAYSLSWSTTYKEAFVVQKLSSFQTQWTLPVWYSQ